MYKGRQSVTNQFFSWQSTERWEEEDVERCEGAVTRHCVTLWTTFCHRIVLVESLSILKVSTVGFAMEAQCFL